MVAMGETRGNRKLGKIDRGWRAGPSPNRPDRTPVRSPRPASQQRFIIASITNEENNRTGIDGSLVCNCRSANCETISTHFRFRKFKTKQRKGELGTSGITSFFTRVIELFPIHVRCCSCYQVIVRWWGTCVDMVLGPFKGGREGKTAAIVAARTPSTTFEIRSADLFPVPNRKMSDVVQSQQTADNDALAVGNFREYLRIPSVHPNINYDDCIKFLEGQAIGLGLPYKVYHTAPTKPVFILTWEGTEPKAPSVMLNSHMDVVPVFEENWTHKPFGAEMDADGKIYARGAQDMKCVGIQYLETIRRLKLNGIRLKRTIHCIFVPDEEMGGFEGMRKFVKTDFFKSLNIGFALDEGMTSEADEFLLYYGERTVWTVVFRCPGQTGHGSLLLDNTAAEKMRHLLDRIYDFREKEKQKLENNPEMTIGDVTTVNVTIMQGGVQSNVLPAEFVVTMDCRIPVTVDHEEWFETLQRWCKEAGKDVAMENRPLAPLVPPTKLDETNKYWMAFKGTIDKLGFKMTPRIFPGGTDSRYLRQLGIPALGFSPINNTPVLLHDDDEYLSAGVFLKGIEIYCKLVSAVANVDSD